MADKAEFLQAINEAILDADSLERFINGDDTQDVLTRLSKRYPTLQKAIKQMFENGGLPATPFKTKALMTASALVDGKYAMVTDDTVNNGLYVKTAGAWVKSSYDPVGIAKDFTKKYTDEVNVSALLNNYHLTFSEAVTAVPVEIRKPNLKIRYNYTEVRQFVNKEVSSGELVNWGKERFWLRPRKVVDGRVNYFDESMIYNFTIGLNNTINEGADNYCAIIPVKRSYDEQGVQRKLNIYTVVGSLKPTQFLPLDSNGKSKGSINGGTRLTNYTIPDDVEYIAVNLEWRDSSGVLINKGNKALAITSLRYIPDNSSNILSKTVTEQTLSKIRYGEGASSYIDYTHEGAVLKNPYFYYSEAPDGLPHISQFVKKVEVQKGNNSLFLNGSQEFRGVNITRIVVPSSRDKVDVFIDVQMPNGTYAGALPESAPIDMYGYANIEWKKLNNDSIGVKLTIDTNGIVSGSYNFNELGKIHPKVLERADKIRGSDKGLAFTLFHDVGVGKTSTNMSLPNAQALPLSKDFTNGALTYNVKGDTDKDHQQVVLVASRTANYYGKSSIFTQAKTNYPNNPAVKMLREEGGAPYKAEPYKSGAILGETMPSQWIHPDMTYIPEGVAGYKYWMINSNFPNGGASQEDANLFVSNNGTDWTRVRSFYESDDAGLGIKTPKVFWTSNYRDGFMPIPINGNSFEFALGSTTETKTITGFLCHDPAISHHNGYVNFYVLYNFGFTGASIAHKYVVCYRTNDGVNWEIVREDGTTMPYNQANAQLIFTKTNGVRNHLWYNDLATVIGGSPASPQVVKVSDTEWYYYARESKNITPSSGNTLYLARYRGTSPYTFDWSSREITSVDSNRGGALWHYAVEYIDGKFYCLYHGFLAESSDGVNFTLPQYPFFWRGMASDIYKPTFVKGHDGKIKLAYSIQASFAVPHPFVAQRVGFLDSNKISGNLKITATLLSEYASLQDVKDRSNTATKDAYADVVVMCIDQRTRTTQVRLLPCVRGIESLMDTLDVSYENEVRVVAYLNTRNGGELEFDGVTVVIDGAHT